MTQFYPYLTVSLSEGEALIIKRLLQKDIGLGEEFLEEKYRFKGKPSKTEISIVNIRKDLLKKFL